MREKEAIMNLLNLCKKILSLLVISSISLVVNLTTVEAELIAHWKFDGNTDDSSAYGYHATEHGNPSYASGACGQAISFDGEDDYIETPDITSMFDLRKLDSSPWTLSFWAKSSVPDQNGPDYPFIFSQSTPSHEENLGNCSHYPDGFLVQFRTCSKAMVTDCSYCWRRPVARHDR